MGEGKGREIGFPGFSGMGASRVLVLTLAPVLVLTLALVLVLALEHICRYFRCMRTLERIFVAIYGVCAHWSTYLSLFTMNAHTGAHI